MSPPALEKKPELHEWMREYLSAFYILNSTRQYGFGPNPITLTEMSAYLQLYGASDPESFIEYVLKMDEEFLKVKAEIQKNKSENNDGQRTDVGK